MVKGSKALAQRAQETSPNGDRNKRKTFAITQRGIKTSVDLAEFQSAALSDIDGGRANLKEMERMTAITGQMIALENLKLRAGFYREGTSKSFLTE
jgi:hypothetical protein